MLRLETGISHTLAAVLKRSTGLFKKIRELDPSRYPHMCQQELIQLHNQNPNIKSNWVSTLIDKLAKYGLVVYDSTLQIYNGTAEISVWALEKHISDVYFNSDLERCDSSSFSSFYHRIKSNPDPEQYLSYPMSFNRKRVFCQLRLHPDRLRILSLYVGNNQFKFSPTSLCSMCRLPENDDIYHLLSRCIINGPLRLGLPKLGQIRSALNIHKIFTGYNCEYVKDLCSFIQQALRLRAFVLNE